MLLDGITYSFYQCRFTDDADDDDDDDDESRRGTVGKCENDPSHRMQRLVLENNVINNRFFFCNNSQ